MADNQSNLHISKKSICVFGASSQQIDESYRTAATILGKVIAENGYALISGAGKSGLMAAVNDGAIAAGGTTIGIIPQFMVDLDWQHKGLSKLIITTDMHERKATMAALSSASIALPGGTGTFEELLELITWRQLGLYKNPIVILNTNGYYNYLLKMLDTAITEGFMSEKHRKIWLVADTPQQAVALAINSTAVNDFEPKIN